jgi:hypothetical protein
VLRLIFTACVLALLPGCIDRSPVSTEFRDPVSGVAVKYTLRHAHEYLAEFDRDFHITFAHSERDVPLEYDSGGFILMSIYRLADGTLVFFDRLDYIVLDPVRETVERREKIEGAERAEFLGCFDVYGKDDSLQFVPPSARPDRYGLLKH